MSPAPSPPAPLLPKSTPARLAKCRALSLGSLTPHRPGLPPTSQLCPCSVLVSPSQGPFPSGTLPDASPAHLSYLPQPCPGCFPLNPALCQPPQSPPPHPSTLPITQLTFSSPSQTSNVSRAFFLLPFNSSHFRRAQLAPCTPTSPPHPTASSPSLRSSPCIPGPTAAAHLGEGPGLRTWRPRSSGAAAPSGPGGQRSLKALRSRRLTEQTAGPACNSGWTPAAFRILALFRSPPLSRAPTRCQEQF